MTLWVARDGQTITIHGNLHLDVKVQDSRVAEYIITEDPGHLRVFHTALGQVLDAAAAEAAPHAGTAPHHVHEAEPGGF